jgi:TetR/AcrR family transcriptional repressor of lmrAB and yxaGH operons
MESVPSEEGARAAGGAGVVKKGELTRARIVDTAARLLTTQGYHGTGLGQVLDESRAPRGSLYFHFPGGKEELAAEALRASAASWRQAVLASLESAPTSVRAIRSVCELLATRLEQSAFQDGCPIATVALEAAPTSDLLHEATAEAYRTWLDVIEARLTAIGMPAGRASRLATLILASIEGAMVLAKATRSGEPLRRVGAELETLLA